MSSADSLAAVSFMISSLLVHAWATDGTSVSRPAHVGFDERIKPVSPGMLQRLFRIM